MALRIHFTDDDFGRTRRRTGPDPLWELVLSLTALQSRRPAGALRVWSARARKQLRREGLFPHPRPVPALEWRRRAMKALPPGGQSGRGEATVRHTGVLRPAERRREIGPVAGDGVVHVEKTRLRGDLQTFFVHGAAPSWSGELAEGARGLLGTALTSYGIARQTPLAPAVRGIRAGAAPIRWAKPELSAEPPADRSVCFGGLLVIPAYFRVAQPEPSAALGRTAERTIEAAQDPLPELLGETRARALHALAVPLSAAELAGQIGVTPVAASKHAGVLRRAGLVESRRDGNTVRHAVTATGLALLSASGG
ncbi:ArsR/SmtB family transcription factor [Amycolatopsis echigonensis]|uniref:Helix-turn-helix protein n=1 Tax=Amycolatopsis echigonensis TaxID=2576905 RepID=A0A2N3WQJ6_9PSEU|nr:MULTISPECIES: winged helix-turn-helix domain-containing protein [Amycolatopsis]MBB2500298.1 winged helix-turn-helix transcriptional regulator [Amycolatopsis echigonensis]PKV96144.1 helix-turn-helix protein [Amycolatopsis niigatensis]